MRQPVTDQNRGLSPVFLFIGLRARGEKKIALYDDGADNAFSPNKQQHLRDLNLRLFAATDND